MIQVLNASPTHSLPHHKQTRTNKHAQSWISFSKILIIKLKLRSLESKQTIKIELPNPSFTLQQLKQTLSKSLLFLFSSFLPKPQRRAPHVISWSRCCHWIYLVVVAASALLPSPNPTQMELDWHRLVSKWSFLVCLWSFLVY